jgi:hypothetical protein
MSGLFLEATVTESSGEAVVVIDGIRVLRPGDGAETPRGAYAR